MSWYSLKEYCKYRWQAKRRHGVHSPLVYGLMDVGLKNYSTKRNSRSVYKNEAGDIWESTKLMARIVDYFQFSEVKKWNPNTTFSSFRNQGAELNLAFNICFDFSENTPVEALHFFQENESFFGESDVLFVGNSHQSTIDIANWKILQEQPGVTLSLDFFSLGILFFSKKIKERQHFILKH